MTFQHTILYNNELNFSLDNTKVDMTPSGTTLAFETENEDYIQTFDTSTGFSITASLMEFSGSRLQQKDQRPAGALIGATFSTIKNASWTLSATSSLTEYDTPVLNAGFLDCLGYADKGVAFVCNDIGNAQNHGFLKIKIKVPFTGAPPQNIGLFEITEPNPASNANKVRATWNTAGNIVISIWNSAGGAIGDIVSAWNPGIGTFELGLSWNTETPSRFWYFFIGGALISTTTVGSMARTDTATRMRVGGTYSYPVCNLSFDDPVLYPTTQSLAYSAGYTLPDTAYAETRSVAPKFQHGALGTIIAANSFTTVESGGCGFSVNVLPGTDTFGYFDGMDWADSDGTYAQSTTQPVFDANLIDESVYGANSAQFAIHMPAGNTQHWIDTMTLNVLEQIGYFTTNPFLIELTEFVADQILSVSEVSTITGSDDIRNVLNIDGVNYWIDTGDSSLKVSTGYLESNSIAEINSNVALINVLIALGASIKLGKYLHSDDGTTTPTLISNIINYSFFGGSPASLPLCTVWGYTRDSAGVIAPNITVKATLKKAVEIGDSVILKGDSSVVSDANGYFEIDLPQTVSYLFSFINSSNAVLYKETASIPVATDKNYDDL